eukprot:gene22132-23187_t
MTMTWRQGGAYALLGPSGCGKTTLLNIISGLVVPSQGSVTFDGVDVTRQPTEKRNIAQVFQFPVIYDTMSVEQNLAFPLKNRGVDSATIKARVKEIAELLDRGSDLTRRARGAARALGVALTLAIIPLLVVSIEAVRILQLFGTSYAAADSTLRILLVGQLAVTLTTTTPELLGMTGYARALFRLNLGAFSVLVVGCTRRWLFRARWCSTRSARR